MNISALMLALSLFINEVTIFNRSRGLKEDYFSSKLVFLLGIALLLREISLFPSLLRAKFESVCFLLEIPLSLLLLECSIIYIWQLVQEYVLLHTDDLLVLLSTDDRLEWLVCHFCCGKDDCSDVSVRLVLRLISFCMLLTVCLLKIK